VHRIDRRLRADAGGVASSKRDARLGGTDRAKQIGRRISISLERSQRDGRIIRALLIRV